MRQELYHYATSLNENLSNVPILYMRILLSLFLIPILITNIWIGLGLFTVYIICYFVLSPENNKYIRGLSDVGCFLLFLGTEFSSLLLIQYKVFHLFLIMIPILIVIYEIIFTLKIKLKIYSQKDKVKKTHNSIILLALGGTGVWCGKMVATIFSANFNLWLSVFLCSVLITGSLSYFQKIVIYKIIEK